MMRRPTMAIGRAMASFVFAELRLFEAPVSVVSVGTSVGSLSVVVVIEEEDDDDDVVVVDDDEVDVKAVVVVDEGNATTGGVDIADSDAG
jgi:hypothetical protein